MSAATAASPTSGPAAASSRRPGRPRRAEVDQAILHATVQLLAREGYDGVTMEGVATEAGVGKATLYRRWPGKTDLILDAVRSLKPDIGHPDTGDTRADLVEIMVGAISWRDDAELTQVVAALMAEMPRNAELADVYRSRFLAPRRAGTVEVLRRGIDRGDIRPDIDLELVLDLLIGAVFYRGLLSGGRLDDGIAELVVDYVLAGIAPRPASKER